MLNKLKQQDGMVMVIGLIIMVLAGFIGMAAIQTSTTDVSISGNQVKRTQAFYLAEAGVERAAAEIIREFQLRGQAPHPLPSGAFDEAAGFTRYEVEDLGPAENQTLTTGAYKGLYGLIKTFAVSAEGRVTNDPQITRITLTVQDALVPVFQFAVFYEDDLEFSPGPDMTIAGRMHTNANMYLGSGNSLYIDSYVTAAGDIIAGRKPGSGKPRGVGNVYIKDGDGNYQGMKDGSDWLDSSDPDWVTESIARWDGKVEDGNHGITELDMPVVSTGPATNLIDPDAGGTNPDSFENKADLKLINGQALYKTGTTWIDVTGALMAAGALKTVTFYNGREGKWVTATELDMKQLGTTPYVPRNGIIYARRDVAAGTEQAVRLVNGAELPAPITLASPNPVYTLGDYNSINKKPASILTDALSILSNSWDDANSDRNLSSRIASNTTINVAFLTGNTVTGEGGAAYNGGLENLPRFLEKWSGKTLTIRGSFVDLWQSRQATGAWGYGKYYKAPIRDWGFDPDFLDPTKLPPGTPQVNVAQRTSWHQDLAAEKQVMVFKY